MLLNFLKSAGPGVTVDGSTREAFSFCVFSDGDEDIGLGVKDGLGLDGFNVRRVLWFRECLIHIGVIGSQLYFL